MQIAVIIPTLNEERTIAACLESIGAQPEVEVLVSDGGSRDRTVELARERGARVAVGAPGRGPQLNLGAASTSAPLLMFVHADCRVSEDWSEAVARALSDPEASLACFRLRTEAHGAREESKIAQWWRRTLDLRSRGWRLPYGDQGFAVRREVFEAVGGFPDIPLMEDVAFARSCRKLGAIARLPMEIRTTDRRYDRNPIRTRVMNLVFPTLFRLGVSPHRLAGWYREVR